MIKTYPKTAVSPELPPVESLQQLLLLKYNISLEAYLTYLRSNTIHSEHLSQYVCLFNPSNQSDWSVVGRALYSVHMGSPLGFIYFIGWCENCTLADEVSLVKYCSAYWLELEKCIGLDYIMPKKTYLDPTTEAVFEDGLLSSYEHDPDSHTFIKPINMLYNIFINRRDGVIA